MKTANDWRSLAPAWPAYEVDVESGRVRSRPRLDCRGRRLKPVLLQQAGRRKIVTLSDAGRRLTLTPECAVLLAGQENHQ